MADFCEDGHLICPGCGQHIEPEIPGKLAAQIAIGIIGGFVSMGVLSFEAIEDAVKAFQSEGAAKGLRMLRQVQGKVTAGVEQALHEAQRIETEGKPEPD